MSNAFDAVGLVKLITKWRASADKSEEHISEAGMEIENETHMRDMRMCADELEDMVARRGR